MKLIQNSPSPHLLSSEIWVGCFLSSPYAHVKASLSCCHNAAAHGRTWYRGKVPAAKAEEQLLCECKSIQQGPSLSILLCPMNFQSCGWILDALHCCFRTMFCSFLVPQLLFSCLQNLGFLDDLWDRSATVTTLPAPQGQVVASVVALPLSCFHMASLSHFWVSAINSILTN